LSPAKDAITVASTNVPLHSNWILDGVGNWKQVNNETRQHSSFNRIIQHAGTPILSDKNGNETDNGTYLFKWDYRNRLRTVSRKGDGAIIAVYSYDALGWRVSKVVSGSGALNGPTDFYYNGWQEIEERNTTDRFVRQYVYGIYVDEPLVVNRNAGSSDTVAVSSDDRSFYHQNTLGSVFALTDTTGKIVEGYQYDAYGRPLVFRPGNNGVVDFASADVISPGDVGDMDNRYLYTGQRYDPETAQ